MCCSQGSAAGSEMACLVLDSSVFTSTVLKSLCLAAVGLPHFVTGIMENQRIVKTGEQPEDDPFPAEVTTVISWYREADEGNRKPEACWQRDCSAGPENIPLWNLRPLQQGFPSHFSQMWQASGLYLSDASVCHHFSWIWQASDLYLSDASVGHLLFVFPTFICYALSNVTYSKPKVWLP